MNLSNPKNIFSIVRLDLPMDQNTYDTTLKPFDQIKTSVFSIHNQDAELLNALKTAHAYHVSSARDDLPRPWFAKHDLLKNCPQLLAVSTFGAGYDTVEVKDCTDIGICVVNQAGSNARAVAEHALGFMIGLAKRIYEGDRRLRRGEKFTRAQGMGFEVEGRALGLIGIGHTGSHFAKIANALGMRVIAYDPFLTPDQIKSRGAESVSFKELLSLSDVVSMHCPRDSNTIGMMNESTFSQMKKGALFIATARGDIYDEAALYQALSSGHLAGAGLDVFSIEPPDATHPLLSLDRVIASYHTAGVSYDARRQMAYMSAMQLIEIAEGKKPSRLVNPEVWPAYCKRFKAILGRDIV